MLELTDHYGQTLGMRAMCGYGGRLAGMGVGNPLIPYVNSGMGYDTSRINQSYQAGDAATRRQRYEAIEAAQEQVQGLLRQVLPLVSHAERLAAESPYGGTLALQKAVGARDALARASEQIHALRGELEVGENAAQRQFPAAYSTPSTWIGESARLVQQAESVARQAATEANPNKLQAQVAQLEQEIQSARAEQDLREQQRIDSLRAQQEAAAQREAALQQQEAARQAAELQARQDAEIRRAELEQRQLEQDQRRYELEQALAAQQLQFQQSQAAEQAARAAAREEREARMDELRMALELQAAGIDPSTGQQIPQQAAAPQGGLEALLLQLLAAQQGYAVAPGQQVQQGYDLSIYAGGGGGGGGAGAAQPGYQSFGYNAGQEAASYGYLESSGEVFGYDDEDDLDAAYSDGGMGGMGSYEGWTVRDLDREIQDTYRLQSDYRAANMTGEAQALDGKIARLNEARAARLQAQGTAANGGSGALSSIASVIDRTAAPAADLIRAATGQSAAPPPAPSGPSFGTVVAGLGLLGGAALLATKLFSSK